MANHTNATKRHDFVLLFDVTDGNPNGDPDAGNLPRRDPETGQGLVTDVAIKRKVRDFVDMAHGTEQRFKIYVQHGEFLTDRRARVFSDRAGGRKDKDVPIAEAKGWMCDEFFDVRMFGAVMSMKEKNAGQVRGPLQLTFARSIDSISYQDVSIVGPAQRRGDTDQRPANEEAEEFPGTMGRKAVVPYGLYRLHGFFNAHFAASTGATDEDLQLFWEALQMMWDQDHSAARGQMNCRGLYIFSHESPLGSAPAHRLFDLIEVLPLLPGDQSSGDAKPPRSFRDYEQLIKVNEAAFRDDDALRDKVTLTRLVG